jgi:hypothetical protein
MHFKSKIASDIVSPMMKARSRSVEIPRSLASYDLLPVLVAQTADGAMKGSFDGRHIILRSCPSNSGRTSSAATARVTTAAPNDAAQPSEKFCCNARLAHRAIIALGRRLGEGSGAKSSHDNGGAILSSSNHRVPNVSLT